MSCWAANATLCYRIKYNLWRTQLCAVLISSLRLLSLSISRVIQKLYLIPFTLFNLTVVKVGQVERCAKRKCCLLNFKEHTIKEYQPGVAGHGFAAIARKHGITSSTLRAWYAANEGLRAAKRNGMAQTKVACRLKGGGRKPLNQVMEKTLHKWAVERNLKGLRVKDQYLQGKAPSLMRDMISDSDPSIATPEFKASKGWLSRFKQRFNLVSHQQTTCRTLLADADVICREFIHKVQSLIDVHNIKDCNIINMDQVPRYFETEPKTTITTRGSREVTLRRGGTSHRKFTITFGVTCTRKHLRPHLLFPKLVKKPKVADGVDVEVNRTGMWSEDITMRYLENTIFGSHKKLSFYREKTLLMLHSYGTHLKLAKKTRLLQSKNILIAVVPKNLTNLLQPLDVGVNWSYQSDYKTKYDTYIAQTISSPDIQTKDGNPKASGYKLILGWAVDWVKACQPSLVRNAFQVCGLVASKDFDLQKLHPPLRALYDGDVDFAEWNAMYGELLGLEANAWPTMSIERPEWFLLVGGCSLWRCLLRADNVPDTDDILDDYIIKILKQMSSLPDLDEIFSNDDATYLVGGEIACPKLILFTVAKIQSWEIKISRLDDKNQVLESFTYETCKEVKKVELVVANFYYCHKLTSLEEHVNALSSKDEGNTFSSIA